MRKRFFVLLILLILLIQPLTAAAAVTPLDPGRKCSLNIHYRKNGNGFPNVQTEIYRIAEASADGTFDLIAPYSGFPISIHGITSQQEWDTVTTTLLSYIIDRKIPADHVTLSNAQGTASFTGLQTGLYLVKGSITKNDEGIYIFRDFLIYLPTPQADGSFDYDLEAQPKAGDFIPKTEYTVKKLWKDSGSSTRPKSVTVNIYKDGVLQETVTLDKSNNWSHSWSVIGNDGIWSVSEKTVPSGYTVCVCSKDNVFTITNSRNTGDSSIPKTGDSFPLQQYTVSMVLAGFLLLHLGILRKRRAL